MKRFIRYSFICCVVLLPLAFITGCGGGGSSSPTPLTALQPSASTTTATSTMTIQLRIPTSLSAVPQSRVIAESVMPNTREPQYLAPQTAFILVDLQNNSNPLFDNTLLVTPAACPQSGGYENCTFSIAIPAGDPTIQQWSVLAGAGKPDGSVGSPLSVVHDVAPCYPFACSGAAIYLNAYLDAIVTDVFHAGLGWSGDDFKQLQPAFSDFMLAPQDAFGNTVHGTYGDDAPINSSGFANPFTLSIDDASGEETLNTINAGGPGPVLGTPFKSQIFSTLAGYHGGVEGIELVNAATVTRTFQVNYSIPKVDLQPREFPQLLKTWSSPAKTGAIMTVTCAPPSSPPNDNDCREIFS